jgi:hypothetical protein
MTYTHYTDDGRMVDDVGYLDAHYHTGVGAYDASWEKIEAEWCMAISGAEKKECSEGGFEVQSRCSGDYVYYPNLQNLPQNAKISFRVSSVSEAIIESRGNGVSGNLLGVCRIPETGGLDKYATVTHLLTNTAGVKDIYLVFKSAGDVAVHLNWFRLERT